MSMNQRLGYDPEALQKLAILLAHGTVDGYTVYTRQFTMRLWSEACKNNRSSYECGTVGCATGWNTYIAQKHDGEEWIEYANRTLCQGDFDDESSTFSFLFNAKWAMVDDGRQGAAQRIQYVLDHGQPPEEWGFNEKTIKKYRPMKVPRRAIPFPVEEEANVMEVEIPVREKLLKTHNAYKTA